MDADLLADVGLLGDGGVLGRRPAGVHFSFRFVGGEQLVQSLGVFKSVVDWGNARTEMGLFARALKVDKPLRGSFVFGVFLNFFHLNFLHNVLFNIVDRRLLADRKISGQANLVFRKFKVLRFVGNGEGALFIQTLRLDFS